MVLKETANLHDGNEESLEVWSKMFARLRKEGLKKVYDRLGVNFDVQLGESFYQDRLKDVVNDLLAKGIARETDGAIGVFLEGYDTPIFDPQAGWGVFICHDRFGHNSSTAWIAGSPTRFSTSLIIGKVCTSSSFSQQHARGNRVLAARRAQAHQLRHRAGQRREAIQNSVRRNRRDWKAY